MARKTYVALATVDYTNEDGKRVFANPSDKKTKGIFKADLTERQESRLLDKGAIRVATKKDLADDVPASEAVIEGEVLPPGDGLDTLSAADLKKVAEDEKIDLGDATKKADVVAAIRKAREGGNDDLLS